MRLRLYAKGNLESDLVESFLRKKKNQFTFESETEMRCCGVARARLLEETRRHKKRECPTCGGDEVPTVKS